MKPPSRIAGMTERLYQARKPVVRGGGGSHPEGKTDNARRWYPSAREDANGDGSKGRSPSRDWPWSYRDRCRTRQHCYVLVTRALAICDVPPDVQRIVHGRETVPDELEQVALEAVAWLSSLRRSAFDCRVPARIVR